MKHIAILGSTGSIGKSTLQVVAGHPRQFRVESLSTFSNIALLEKQIAAVHPRRVCVVNEDAAAVLARRVGRKTRVLSGREGLLSICGDTHIQQVIMAVSGSDALMPLLAALHNGLSVGLANKEALVMAGDIVMQASRNYKAPIVPIDSEQSAIWQCLEGESQDTVRKIYLTASGGPFWNSSDKEFAAISPEKALLHPRWQMGRKITIDSATLMNKGFEVIEAMHLFGVPVSMIDVVIHPQAIIHSMVEFIDGVVLAQLSATDMRIPIQYALTYPRRIENKLAPVDFCAMGALTFAAPDTKRFACLALALEAARAGGTLPAVLNAANDIAVQGFMEKRISFVAIPRVIERVMARHRRVAHPAIAQVMDADAWARREALAIVDRMN